MTGYISQKEYLNYFDAIKEVNDVTHLGIERTKLTPKPSAMIPKFHNLWITDRIRDLVFLVRISWDDAALVKRQGLTTKKVKHLKKQIKLINDTRAELAKYQLKAGSQDPTRRIVTNILDPDYYTLRGIQLDTEAAKTREAWNKIISLEAKNADLNLFERIQLCLRRWLGMDFAPDGNTTDLLIVEQTIKGYPTHTPKADPFIALCDKVRGFVGKHRMAHTFDNYRLQTMGGFTPQAKKYAQDVLDAFHVDLIVNEEEKQVLTYQEDTLGSYAALESYLETMRLMIEYTPEGHPESDQERLDLPFQICLALSMAFFKSPDLDSMEQIFKAVIHHFNHSKEANEQLIMGLIQKIIKPYCIAFADKMPPSRLKKLSDHCCMLFQNDQHWIASLFFKAIVFELARKDKTLISKWETFTSDYLIGNYLSVEYASEQFDQLKKNP